MEATVLNTSAKSVGAEVAACVAALNMLANSGGADGAGGVGGMGAVGMGGLKENVKFELPRPAADHTDSKRSGYSGGAEPSKEK